MTTAAVVQPPVAMPPVTSPIRRAKQLLITVLCLLGIVGGLGLPSGAAAAVGVDIYAGAYAGSAVCGARGGGWTGSSYRWEVYCSMSDRASDGKGIYASMRNANTGAWYLTASECKNTAGAGTTTHCSKIIYTSAYNPLVTARFGWTDNGSFYQYTSRTVYMR